jgi:hypothetical protein
VDGLAKCKCCGADSLPETEEIATFEICDVCQWQDDPVQNDKPDYPGGANQMSLNEARKAFAEGRPVL